MGELGDDFRAMREHRKKVRAGWDRKNRAIIDAGGIAYDERDNVMLFRVGDIVADFYPSTGRWREPRENRTHDGGAKAFLAWLRDATEPRSKGASETPSPTRYPRDVTGREVLNPHLQGPAPGRSNRIRHEDKP